MKRNELMQRTDTAISDMRKALQTVYDCLNEGQKKQLVKADSVRILFDRYGVEYKK